MKKQKKKKLHKTDMEQGHWVLAKLGKRVLRPGGLELTRLMLDEMDINKADDVVEFAPGLGQTARLTVTHQPHSYTAIELNKAAAERGDFKEAERIWTELAKAGDAKAQYNLAIIHYYGEETGLPTDDSEVRSLLEKAVAQNIPEAQYHLALLLLDAKHGLNITALNKTPVTSERKRGVELLAHAAEAGVPEAQAMLAALYHHGVKDVLEKDNGKHIAWQEKAAEKIAYTAYLTGEGYETGLEGFPVDCEKAKHWYQKAHDMGMKFSWPPKRDLCAPKNKPE